MLRCMCISFFLILVKLCQMVVGRKFHFFWKQCANRVYFKTVSMKQGGVLRDVLITVKYQIIYILLALLCRRVLNMFSIRTTGNNLIIMCGGTINDRSFGVDFVRKQVELQHRNLNPLVFTLDSRNILLLMLCLTEA